MPSNGICNGCVRFVCSLLRFLFNTSHHADLLGPTWSTLALQEWPAERGLHIPPENSAIRAAQWLAHEIRADTCNQLCQLPSCTCMRCSECSREFGSKCSSMEPNCMWDIDFCCPACVVDSLFVLPIDDSPGSPYLLHLALQTMKSSSARLALSTWRNYLRCVQKAIEFTIKHGVVCFPVVDKPCEALCFFFNTCVKLVHRGAPCVLFEALGNHVTKRWVFLILG